MKWPQAVTIKEVGPRDGLQNENRFVATVDKVKWINQLSRSGLSYIEVTSFVHPKWIPALADSEEVSKTINREEGVRYAALVPNQKGLEKAIESNVDEIAVFLSVSETHNKKNINKSIQDTLPILQSVIHEAKSSGKTVRGYLSTVFGCPYEGEISYHHVLKLCDKLFEMGVYELSLGDTIGVASPKQVQDLLSPLLKRFSAKQIAMHFHDTRGTALANVTASLDAGISIFDSSLGGLGGCPYAPGASGNVATDDLLYMLHKMDIQTGVEMKKLHKAAVFIQDRIGRPLSSYSMLVDQNK